MSTTSTAERYHSRTKYTREGIARAGKRLDFDKQPSLFKDYAGEAYDLARYLPDGDRILSDEELRELRLSVADDERTLALLSHWLYLTNGVTAVIPYPERPFLMRAAPSAGGLYPTEIYVVASGCPGLPDGIYNYQVRDHSLIRFWKQDPWPQLKDACFDHPALATPGLALVLSGVFERSAWRYEDRAYRRVLLDTGHVMGNAVAYAPWLDHTVFPIGGFADDRLNELLFLPPEDEGSLAVLALLAPGSDPQGPTALPSHSKPERELPDGHLIPALHGASSIREAVSPTPANEPAAKYPFAYGEGLEAAPLRWGLSLGETIIQRRSTRAYSGEPLSREQLAQILDFAYRPDLNDEPRVEHRPRLFSPELLQTFIAVNAVESLEAGCYHYDPERRSLRQIRFKRLQAEVQYLSLGQDLGGTAGAVVFHTTNLPNAVRRYGDRCYRYLHMDAGHLGERMNLAAMRLRLGASGIGGFFDDEVNELLGIPDSEAVVYITTLGVPSRR